VRFLPPAVPHPISIGEDKENKTRGQAEYRSATTLMMTRSCL
jgi:hypothetical protein